MSENGAIVRVDADMALTKPPEASLGSLLFSDPDALVKGASKLATTLAKIIEEKNLYKMIGGKKYVVCEGWCTLGALIGIVPAEDWSKRLPNEEGYESRIKLIRTRDGMEIGGASAECTYDEQNWEHRDRYALKSMSQTRATGKAFRLSFSWMMVLAGYAPTPAEEVPKDGFGSREAAQAVARRGFEEKLKSPDPQIRKLAQQGLDNLDGKASDVTKAQIPTGGINLPPVPSAAPPVPKTEDGPNTEYIHGIVKRVVTKQTKEKRDYREIGILDQHDRTLTLSSFDNFQLSGGRLWQYLCAEAVGQLATFVVAKKEKNGKQYMNITNIESIGNRRWEDGVEILDRDIWPKTAKEEPQVPLD